MSDGAYAHRPMAATKPTMERFAELATVQVCKQFKLAYYRGQGSTLARVE